MSNQRFTYANGYRAPANGPNPVDEQNYGERASYVPPDPVPKPTSIKANAQGIFNDPTYPSILAGTCAPDGPPKWFKKEPEVDVVILAGPSGLEVAVSLLRQGVSFRIVDKAPAPLLVSWLIKDGVQPRLLGKSKLRSLPFLMLMPIHTHRNAIWKDGRNLFWGHSHQSDSRYRGLHVITQTAIEHIYIRDLLRHKKIVERRTTVKSFTIDESGDESHPVTVTLVNEETGELEVVRAKYLVGADGANSTIRKQLGIKFEGETTDIHWGIMDAVFETDYPHALCVKTEW